MRKKILPIIISSHFSLLPLCSIADENNIGVTDVVETVENVQSSSRDKRSILYIGRFLAKPPVSVLAQPLKGHFSQRLLNLISFGLISASTSTTEFLAAELLSEATAATLDASLASEATIFSQLPEIAATDTTGASILGEEGATDILLHPVNIPIVETMALIEDSGIYPIASYSNVLMRNAFIEMESGFSDSLKDAIVKGYIQRANWSFFPESAQARSVIRNEIRALTGKWARNFEIGEYDPINKKVDVRIFHRGVIDNIEERHIFNVARRLHLTGAFNITNAADIFTADEALVFSESEFSSSEVAETNFQKANIPGKVISHEGRNYLVTNQLDKNGLKQLANSNGTRLRAGQQAHLVLGNLNGNAVAVFEENGSFRLLDRAGSRPILLRTGGANFVETPTAIDESNLLPPDKGFNAVAPQSIINPDGLTNNCYYSSAAMLLNFESVKELVAHTGRMQSCGAGLDEITSLFRDAGSEIESRRYLSKEALHSAMLSLPEGSSAGIAFTRPKRINEFGKLVDQIGHMIVGHRNVGGVDLYDFQANPIDATLSGWRYSLPHDAYNFLLITPK